MVADLPAEKVAELLRSRSEPVVLLDVREDWEREASHIEPSLHIPMNSLPDRLQEVPRDRLVVVYCHHGSRSQMVAGYLEGEGFPRIANLRGGIDSWSLKVDPKVPRYG